MMQNQPQVPHYYNDPPVQQKKQRKGTVILLVILAAMLLFVMLYLLLRSTDCEITLLSSNPHYGTVQGDGVYEKGQTITIRANPAPDCVFSQWSDGSTEAVRTVTVKEDTTYTAQFYGPVQTGTSLPDGAMVMDEAIMYQYLIERVSSPNELAPDGYICAGKEMQMVKYVSQWPDGFSQDHPLYEAYNKKPTYTAGERHAGYIYWHWCRGDYTAGPINRTTSPFQKDYHNSFHAYYSTVIPNITGDYFIDGKLLPNPTPDGTYHHPDACCKDTYWFYVLPVMECSTGEETGNYIHELWSIPMEEPPMFGEYCTVTQYTYRPY